MTPGRTATLLRAVEADELPAALAAALDGGAPVAPLPSEPVEQARARHALGLEEPADPEAAVVVLSSGSTAEPKGVVLSAAAIQAGAAATHDRLGGPGHWLLPMPGHYVAGLMVLARAHLAGTAVVPLARDLSDLPAARARGRAGWGRRRGRPDRPGWTPSSSAAAPRTPPCSTAPGRPASPASRRTG